MDLGTFVLTFLKEGEIDEARDMYGGDDSSKQRYMMCRARPAHTRVLVRHIP